MNELEKKLPSRLGEDQEGGGKKEKEDEPVPWR